MKDSGVWGSCCTIICCAFSLFRRINSLISISIAWVLVRAPFPITKISSRAIKTSPPSMVRTLWVLPEMGGIVSVWVLNSGVKSKIDCMITDSRSRMELAIRPINTSLYILIEASRVKKKLCMGRNANQSLLKNFVRLSLTISTPSINRRERFSAFSSSNCSFRLPFGDFSPINGSIRSIRSSTSCLILSSFRILHNRSLTS